MELILASHSSYPRIGESAEFQSLRRTIASWEKGEKTDSDLRAAEDRMTELALSEQAEAGLDVVTDGQIRWYDPVSHLAGKLQGVRINGLLRFFDTNFYFRQPAIESEIKRTKPLIVEEFVFAKKKSARPVKPVLTGPYTLARLSIQDEGKAGDFEKTLAGYSGALAEEVKAGLQRARADLFLHPGAHPSIAQDHPVDVLPFAQQVCGGDDGREVLRSADVAREHDAEPRRQLARLRIARRNRHSPVEGLGAVRQIADALARHAVRLDRRDECARLHEHPVAAAIDPAHESVCGSEEQPVAHCAGGREALRPEILHPEQDRRALQGPQRARRDADRHRRGLVDEDGIEAAAR